ncbi:MAG: leucyl/phenylalanyl-tRNA--protein transferase [Boseongicola sp.]|nr:leucyl/phenylalanyl-tRNA--protein transferase [Boseongicola sp.]
MADKRLTPELLLAAYASGIFPMAESRDDPDIYWVDPKMRGVLPLDGFRVSRSLARRLRKTDYHVTIDHSLDAVLDGCADRDETWINDTIRGLTHALHRRGNAHSIEVWVGSKIIGGVYGITLGGAFFGESMFSDARDGSKIALTWLVDHLRRCGFTLFDTQFVTPHLISLGAIEVPRNDYHEALTEAIITPTSMQKVALETDRYAVLQRMTQTS